MNDTKGFLYLVATPIGNLDDLTIRAVKTLNEVDFIAAEDTRHTLKLLNHFEIKKTLISYYEHNIRQKGEYIISQISEGKNVALVSDAGTPAICDPGEDLVKLCIENNIRVIPIPGANAGINALICSGLSTKRFSFEGFLSVNKKNRKEHLNDIKDSTYTLIFYEAPHKLKNTLIDMYEYFGNRRICIAREITKRYEDIILTTLADSVNFYDENIPKGEFVLVIEGIDKKIDAEKEILNELSIPDHINHYIKIGFDKKEAIKQVAKDRNCPKRDIYSYTI